MEGLECYGLLMAQAPVELQIGGRSYRFIASAGEGELQRLAQLVEECLVAVAGPSRVMSAQNLLLVAMKLAHDLEEERDRRFQGEMRAKQALKAMLSRIDAVLDESPPPPPVAEVSDRPKPNA